jgi:hypothetical protein
MPAEPLALSTVPPASSVDTDYDAICAAVTATARGRWFLDEFARRNRNTDTLQVLDAIARMEAAVVSERTKQTDKQANQEVRIELLEMGRAIARARADVAESRPESQELAAKPAGTTAAPDITGAAERLRQIAWTMRACSVEIATSDQIGQIADAILSADALRNLGDQRARKLTEALHHLEHRIDRMLDGHLSAAIADAEKLVAETPRAAGPDREAAPETTAAAIGAAMFAAAAALEAETEPAHSPANDDIPPAAVWEEAAEISAPEEEALEIPPPEQALQIAVPEEAAQAGAVAETVPAAAADVTEYPMDDDVVLTVADSVIDVEQPPLPSIELEPAFFISSPREPTPLPSMEMEPASFVASAPERAAPAESMDAAEPELKADVQALQAERVELEVEPLTVAADTETEAAFAGLELEPLVVTPAIAAEPQAATQPEQARSAAVAQEQEPDQPARARAFTIDEVLSQLHMDVQPAQSPAAEPASEVDFGEDANLTLTRTTVATTAALPEPPETIAAIEPIAAPAAIAEPRVAPPPAAIAADPIAMQVDYDLADLTDIMPGISRDGGTRAAAPPPPPVPAPPPASIPANAMSEDDPADFLLEALPVTKPPGNILRETAPVPAASPQPSSALFANTLAAIETELRAGATPATARAEVPAPLKAGGSPAPAAVTPTPSVTDGRLAALMALSEEERIALFS